jgi:hypothetical protein
MIGSLAVFDDRRDALKPRLAGEASVEFGPYPAHWSFTRSHPVSPLGGGAGSEAAGSEGADSEGADSEGAGAGAGAACSVL